MIAGSLPDGIPADRSPTRPSRRPRAEARAVRGFRHVVVCLDRSPSAESAIPHAIALAAPTRARVTLLHVLEPRPKRPDSPLVSDPLDWSLRGAESLAYLETLREAHAPAGVPVEAAVVEGPPAEQVCAFAAEKAADVVVFATHGERGASGWRLGSVAHKLFEGLPTSFLLVPGDPDAAPTPAGADRVLVPLDGSVRAESALPIALRLARERDAEVVLAHAVGGTDRLETEPVGADDQDLERRLARRNEAQARAYLTRLADRLREGGARVRAAVLRGDDARRELSASIAAERADLVVMSAHGRASRVEDPAGSVATHLVGSSAVPVLVLRDRAAWTAWRRRSRRAAAEALPPSLGPLAR
jgi:nucleotide-binding universal stress UspA family protein